MTMIPGSNLLSKLPVACSRLFAALTARCLPLAHVVNKDVFVTHGGLPRTVIRGQFFLVALVRSRVMYSEFVDIDFHRMFSVWFFLFCMSSFWVFSTGVKSLPAKFQEKAMLNLQLSDFSLLVNLIQGEELPMYFL